MLCMWMFKIFLSIKIFPNFFLFLHCLSYHLLTIYACWFFTSVTGTTEMLAKFWRLKLKKTHNPPFLFPLSAACSKGLPRIRKEAKKAAKESIVNKLIKSKWDYDSYTRLPPFGGSLYRLLIFMLCFTIC